MWWISNLLVDVCCSILLGLTCFGGFFVAYSIGWWELSFLLRMPKLLKDWRLINLFFQVHFSFLGPHYLFDEYWCELVFISRNPIIDVYKLLDMNWLFYHHLLSQVQPESHGFPSAYLMGWWELIFFHENQNIAFCVFAIELTNFYLIYYCKYTWQNMTWHENRTRN